MFIYNLYGLKLFMLIFYDNESSNTTFMKLCNFKEFSQNYLCILFKLYKIRKHFYLP